MGLSTDLWFHFEVELQISFVCVIIYIFICTWRNCASLKYKSFRGVCVGMEKQAVENIGCLSASPLNNRTSSSLLFWNCFLSYWSPMKHRMAFKSLVALLIMSFLHDFQLPFNFFICSIDFLKHLENINNFLIFSCLFV